MIVDQMGDDIAEIVDLIEQVSNSGKLAEKWAIGVDPIGAGQILEELAARDLAERIFGVQQGYKLHDQDQDDERKLVDGTLCARRPGAHGVGRRPTPRWRPAAMP